MDDQAATSHAVDTEAREEHTIVVPREAISCPLCTEPYETAEPHTPCVLGCVHTFCRQCLVGWAQSRGGAAAGAAAGAVGFSCPKCREVCTVPVAELKINYALMEVVEAEHVSTGHAKLVCHECDEESEPTHHCQECSLLMCEDCTKHHRRTKLGKHHTLQPIEEFKQCKKAIPNQKRTCKKHNDQGLDLYCWTCDTLICVHGSVKDHLGHEYDFLPDVAGKHQANLCMEANKVSEIRTTLEEGIAKIKQEENALAAEAIEKKALIGTHFEELSVELRVGLRARELVLTCEVDDVLAKKKKLLAGQREGLERAATSMESASKNARRAAQLGDQFEVMYAYGQIVQGMQELRKRSFNLHPITSATISFVDTCSGTLSHTLSQHARVIAADATLAVALADNAGLVEIMCRFQHLFDTNGVLYYIATNGGKKAYTNPHTSARVVASLSSCYSAGQSSPARFVQGTSHDGQCNRTDNKPGSWMAVDLKRLLAPTHYCLRSGPQVNSHKLRNWRLEGSKDGSSWKCLREHVNDFSLADTKFSVAAWPIENADAAVFRHFRVYQTGKNSSGDNLMCAGIELYGALRAEVAVMFKFQYSFDTKGVLYHIATNGGKRDYVNPHTSARVVASLSSSSSHSSPARFVQGDSHDGQHNYTDHKSGSWMAVDLKRLLAPTHYCLRSSKHANSHKLRNWRLEGSKDGSSWKCLREHVNDFSLADTKFSVASWPIENADTAVFRHFRVYQTCKNSSGDNHLMCAGIELYGMLRNEECT